MRASSRIVPPSGRELDRVGQQIDQDIGDLGRVGFESTHARLDIDGHRLSPQLEIGRELLDHALDDRPSSIELGVERLAEFPISDQLEHAFDRPGQPRGGGADPVDPLALHRRGGLALRHLPEVDHAQHHRQRRVELVAGDFDERAFDAGWPRQAWRWFPAARPADGSSRRSGRGARPPAAPRPQVSRGRTAWQDNGRRVPR